jgi:prefoldin subunit 5
MTAATPASYSVADRSNPNTPLGIPEAVFIRDVDAFVHKHGGVERILVELNEVLSKYKFMEQQVEKKRADLSSRIPNIQRALDAIHVLKDQEGATDIDFRLASHVFAKATVKNADRVCLWLGANVMVEYSYSEAMDLLSKNQQEASTAMEEQLKTWEFVKDQITTTEVNLARVYNYDVKRRRAQEEQQQS